MREWASTEEVDFHMSTDPAPTPIPPDQREGWRLVTVTTWTNKYGNMCFIFFWEREFNAEENFQKQPEANL